MTISYIMLNACLKKVYIHRFHTLAFIGMGPRESYLATKMINDKFIALDNRNCLFCWSVVTGKLLSTKKLPFL